MFVIQSLNSKWRPYLSKNKTLKKYWKMGKNTGKVREFCQSGKVGTLLKPYRIAHDKLQLAI